jgi:hypothetical protein
MNAAWNMLTPRLRWILVTVLVLGGVDALLAVADRKVEEAHEVHPGDPLVKFDPAGVAKLTLARKGKKPLVLARTQPQGGSWVVASAKDFPAQGTRVEQTLATILGWKRDRTGGDAAMHEKFAVTRDTGITIRIEDFSGQTICELIQGSLTGLDVNQAHANGGQVDTSKVGRFVRLANEEPIYVIPGFVTSEFEPEVQQWLERPITGGDESKARALIIRRKSGENLSVLLDPPYPRFATPDAHPVDADKVHGLVREVLNAYAVETIDGDDAKLGLQPPLMVAEVVLGEGTKPVQLLLGETAPTTSGVPASYVARVPEKPGPLLIPQMAVAQLYSATSESVALNHVFGEKQPNAITKAVFRDGPRSVTLEHGTGAAGWSVSVVDSGVNPAPRKLDSAHDPKRLRVLNAIVQLPTVAFDHQGLLAHGLVQESAGLSLELGKEHIELTIGALEGPVLWVRRHDLPCAIGVAPEALGELRAAFAALGE